MKIFCNAPHWHWPVGVVGTALTGCFPLPSAALWRPVLWQRIAARRAPWWKTRASNCVQAPHSREALGEACINITSYNRQAVDR